jgi:hypothetical protein
MLHQYLNSGRSCPHFWSFPCSPRCPLFFFPTPSEGKVSSDSNLPTPSNTPRAGWSVALCSRQRRSSPRKLLVAIAGVLSRAWSCCSGQKFVPAPWRCLCLAAAFVSPPTSRGRCLTIFIAPGLHFAIWMSILRATQENWLRLLTWVVFDKTLHSAY